MHDVYGFFFHAYNAAKSILAIFNYKVSLVADLLIIQTFQQSFTKFPCVVITGYRWNQIARQLYENEKRVRAE